MRSVAPDSAGSGGQPEQLVGVYLKPRPAGRPRRRSRPSRPRTRATARGSRSTGCGWRWPCPAVPRRPCPRASRCVRTRPGCAPRSVGGRWAHRKLALTAVRLMRPRPSATRQHGHPSLRCNTSGSARTAAADAVRTVIRVLRRWWHRACSARLEHRFRPALIEASAHAQRPRNGLHRSRLALCCVAIEEFAPCPLPSPPRLTLHRRKSEKPPRRPLTKKKLVALLLGGVLLALVHRRHDAGGARRNAPPPRRRWPRPRVRRPAAQHAGEKKQDAADLCAA